MPLPKIRDGQKISLMLPAKVITLLKEQAADEGKIPALIILEALDQYWDGNSPAANPTDDPTPRQRKAYTKLLRHLEDLIIGGKVTVAEIAGAAGVDPVEVQGAWRTSGFVPVVSVAPVLSFLASKNLPISRKA